MSDLFRDGFIDEIVDAYVKDFGDRVENTDRFEHYSPGHARRVAETSVAICEGLDFEEEDIRVVKTAGLLHDIGEVIQKTAFYGGLLFCHLRFITTGTSPDNPILNRDPR